MLRCLSLVLICVLLAGCSGSAAPTTDTQPAPTASAGDADTQLVSLKIPSMHCPHDCWPKVKKTLEQQPGVAEVTLAKQAEEGKIDNPVVEIKTGASFDVDQAIAALKDANFDDAALVQ
jgi:copper chaperone CopZ